MFMVIFLHAQTQPPVNSYDSLITGKKFFRKFKWSDPMVNKLKKNLFSYETPRPGSMPKKFLYLGNNQNGFDVYQTMQDNMYILKPDSTFVSNMPIIKIPSQEKLELNERKN
jgi:hypothetical protein